VHSFTDRTGRAWNLEITVAALKRVRDLAKVDLCQVGDGVEVRLDDLALMGEVIFALLEPQAKAAGVSLDAFLVALDGPAAAGAMAAFWEEMHAFFRPCLPLVGALIAVAAKTAREVRAEQAAQSTSGGESTGSQEPSASIQAP
jgi:hypothetical protein